jgi:hypothetical protein
MSTPVLQIRNKNDGGWFPDAVSKTFAKELQDWLDRREKQNAKPS